MELDFWHTRWAEGRLGFHQAKVNSRLRKFWHEFATDTNPGGKVFAPLCGKSLDMLWLAEAGYPVIGVEISDIACRDFYTENQLPYTQNEGARFTRYQGGGIDIWCGDFFALTPADLRDTLLVYDRAGLIALPESMRADYASHLGAILQPGAKILLIGMDYDQQKMKGPPFSVPEEVIRSLFEKEFSIDIITQSSGPDIVGNLRERGLDTLNEKVYRLQRL